MRTLRNFKKLKKLLEKHLFTTAEARKVGVNSSLLCYYAKKGYIERIDRGIYCGKDSPEIDVDFQWEDLIMAAKSISNGVVCLVSALALYELTDEIPRQHWIAVPHSARAPKRNGVKVVRMRNMILGRTKLDVGNQTIEIFNRERTIVDAFRYLGKEAAIKALKNGLKMGGDNRIQMKRLQAYAKTLRVDLTHYLLAVTT